MLLYFKPIYNKKKMSRPNNKINEISPNLRDSLLRYNLTLAQSVKNYNPSGIGLPITMSNKYNVVDSIDLVDFGREQLSQLTNNIYTSSTLGKLESIELNDLSKKSIEGGYYLNGKINGISSNPYGSLINTLGGSGFLENIQYTTLSEFAGVSLGLIDDTDLGKIGNKQLWKMIGYNASNHIYKSTAGKLNLNINSLLRGDDFLKGDYKITRKTINSLVDILDPALSVLGYNTPYVSMSQGSSLFRFENNYADIGNKNTELLNNSILKETGNGLVTLLKYNLEANLDTKFTGGGIRYIPNYEFNGSQIGKNKNSKGDFDDSYLNIINSESNGVFSDYKTLTSPDDTETTYKIDKGLNSLKTVEGDNVDYDGNPVFRTEVPFAIDYKDNKKSILDKTQDLFNSNKIKTILNDKGSIDLDDSELYSIHANESRKFSGKAISKGSQFVYLEKITSKSYESDPNKYFCRSWVNGYAYDKVNRLQKKRGLDTNIGIRRNTELSVLDTNGFVRYSPYSNDPNTIAKKYMFSIENLAWANDLINLPEWEIGNGDPLTGTTGRIMWFPPYELTFSESTSSNLDTHNFIGRSEPVYTYNSTERTGNLEFKIIIDHPQYMNDKEVESFFGSDYEDALQSLIAGCGDLRDIKSSDLTEIEKQAKDVTEAKEEEIKLISEQKGPESFKIYFPNDVASLSGTTNMDEFDTWYKDETDLKGKVAWGRYELDGSELSPEATSWVETKTEGFTPGITTNRNGYYPDKFNYGLNNSWRNKSFLTKLSTELKEKCPACKVFISGYASTDGKTNSNLTLSNARAKNVADFLKETILKDDTVSESIRFGASNETIEGKGETGVKDSTRQDSLGKKKARHVTVSFKPDITVQKAIAAEAGKDVGDAKNKLGKEIKKLFYNEAEYFKRLAQSDSIVLKKLSDKIKYFSPAFHSTTPEGFNGRLTFLQQCMRQGSTQSKDSNRPNNMAFGMPPVCILRIGDFYNCKVIFDSLNISYEQLWDVNPEGVGVQPLIASVSLSFKMLGGSSMLGPINQLQNAISFNYYANTEIFDPRSNYFTKFDDGDAANKVDIKRDGESVSSSTRYRGTYTNGVNDLNLLLNNIYTSREETSSPVESNIENMITPYVPEIPTSTSEGVMNNPD